MNYFMINDQYIALRVESILQNMHIGGTASGLDIKRPWICGVLEYGCDGDIGTRGPAALVSAP